MCALLLPHTYVLIRHLCWEFAVVVPYCIDYVVLHVCCCMLLLSTGMHCVLCTCAVLSLSFLQPVKCGGTLTRSLSEFSAKHACLNCIIPPEISAAYLVLQ